ALETTPSEEELLCRGELAVAQAQQHRRVRQSVKGRVVVLRPVAGSGQVEVAVAVEVPAHEVPAISLGGEALRRGEASISQPQKHHDARIRGIASVDRRQVEAAVAVEVAAK